MTRQASINIEFLFLPLLINPCGRCFVTVVGCVTPKDQGYAIHFGWHSDPNLPVPRLETTWPEALWL